MITTLRLTGLVSLFKSCFCLLHWTLLAPSRWKSALAHLSPTLTPDFCLVQLNADHIKNPEFRRLIANITILLPCTVSAIALTFIALTRGLNINAMTGTLIAIVLVSLIGALICFAAMPWCYVVCLPVFITIFSTNDLILFDFFTKPYFALAYGTVILLVMPIVGALGTRKSSLISAHELGSVFIGLFVGASVFLGIVFVSSGWLLQIGERQSSTNSAFGDAVVILCTIFAATTLIAGISNNGRNCNSVLVAAIEFCILAVVCGRLSFDPLVDPDSILLMRYTTVLITSTFFALLALPYALVKRIAGTPAGVIAGIIAGTTTHMAVSQVLPFYDLQQSLLVALPISIAALYSRVLRPVLLYPFEAALATILFRLDERRVKSEGRSKLALRWHPVFWDEGQHLPLGGLDGHLLLAYEHNPEQFATLFEFVRTSKQNWASREAQIEIAARMMEQVTTTLELAQLSERMPKTHEADSYSHVYSILLMLAGDTNVAHHQSSAYNQRVMLIGVQSELEKLLEELTITKSRQSRRYLPVISTWQRVIGAQIEALQTREREQREIPSPYIVGLPLRRHQSVFVGRGDIGRQIEQIINIESHPPLLLYGQRRMGKTSVLQNLPLLVPHRFLCLMVDLQGPPSHSTSHASFLYNVSKAMSVSAAEQGVTFPRLAPGEFQVDPFTVFDDWLDAVEDALTASNREAVILALDEFETLDTTLTRGDLREESILGMLRNIAQHRQRFKLVLAGSHTLDEFRRWSTYLINAHTIRLGFLTQSEAIQLIEHPIKDFSLRYEPEAVRRVLQLTQGHPYLVQLLCSEIIALKNTQQIDRRFVTTVVDVEGAISNTLERGHQFFSNIAYEQVQEDAIEPLHRLALRGTGAYAVWHDLVASTSDSRNSSKQLKRLVEREILVMNHGNDSVSFAIELVRRFFAERRV